MVGAFRPLELGEKIEEKFNREAEQWFVSRASTAVLLPFFFNSLEVKLIDNT